MSGAAPGPQPAPEEVATLEALSVDYAAAADALDGPAFAAVFTGDGELWVPGRDGAPGPVLAARGRDALERVPGGLARYHATRHRPGPTIFVVDGAVATGWVAATAHHLVAEVGGAGTDTVWHLRYEDAYRRTADGWRIARRTLHLERTEVVPLDDVGPPGPGRPGPA